MSDAPRDNLLEERLRLRRRGMFDQFRSGVVECSQGCLDFQIELLDEILEAEEHAAASVEYQNHINRIRAYGDALAFCLVSPHAIHVLSQNGLRPASLSGQRSNLNPVVSAARRIASNGVPVLMADLTNFLAIGDLIVCHDPDRPTILECKTGRGGTYKMPRRYARQQARMQEAAEYLKRDSGWCSEHKRYRRAISTRTRLQRLWSEIETVVRAARANKEAFNVISTSDAIVAIDAQTMVSQASMPVRMGKILESYWMPICGLSSQTAMNPTATVPPHVWWPVGDDVAWTISEAEVALYRLVDLEFFRGFYHSDGEIVEVRVKDGKLAQSPFVVQTHAGFQFIGGQFVTSLLFGYATLESLGRQIVEQAALAASPDVVSVPFGEDLWSGAKQLNGEDQLPRIR